MKLVIFNSACVVLFVIPVIFILHNVYRDGIIGRIFLSGIALSAALGLLDGMGAEERYIDPPNLMVAMTVAFAGFLCWHLWSFHRRVLKRSRWFRRSDCSERRVEPDRRYLTH